MYDENERKKKRLPHNFLMKGRNLYGCIRRLVIPISMNFGSMILDTANSLVMSESVPKGWFFKCGHMNDHHKTRNGWYLGLVAPVSSTVRLLILYS